MRKLKELEISSSPTKTMTHDGVKYPVAWILTRIGKGRKLWLGFCGKTNHVFTLATNFLTPMIVMDLFNDEKECEEGKRCLYFACPFNRCTPQTVLEKLGFGQVKKTSE